MRSPQEHKIDLLIGCWLRMCRKRSGLTQSAVAAKLGVSFQQVQKYERATNRISVSRLLTILEVLGQSPHELLIEMERRHGRCYANKRLRTPALRQPLNG